MAPTLQCSQILWEPRTLKLTLGQLRNPCWMRNNSKDSEPDCIPFSTNTNLKCKKRMLYFPMDIGKLTIDGLTDTGALSSAIPEMDRLLSQQSVIGEGSPPNFQIWSHMDN